MDPFAQHKNKSHHIYFSKFDHEIQSCMLAIDQFIEFEFPQIVPLIKYGVPFYTYKNKNVCYLNFSPKTYKMYLGFIYGKFIDHDALISENRKLIKILPIDPKSDIDVSAIKTIIQESIQIITKQASNKNEQFK